MIEDWHESEVTSSEFKFTLNKVPFDWKFLGETSKMLYIGGLVGVSIGSDSALKPVFGYAIAEDRKDDVEV